MAQQPQQPAAPSFSTGSHSSRPTASTTTASAASFSSSLPSTSRFDAVGECCQLVRDFDLGSRDTSGAAKVLDGMTSAEHDQVLGVLRRDVPRAVLLMRLSLSSSAHSSSAAAAAFSFSSGASTEAPTEAFRVRLLRVLLCCQRLFVPALETSARLVVDGLVPAREAATLVAEVNLALSEWTTRRVLDPRHQNHHHHHQQQQQQQQQQQSHQPATASERRRQQCAIDQALRQSLVTLVDATCTATAALLRSHNERGAAVTMAGNPSAADRLVALDLLPPMYHALASLREATTAIQMGATLEERTTPRPSPRSNSGSTHRASRRSRGGDRAVVGGHAGATALSRGVNALLGLEPHDADDGDVGGDDHDEGGGGEAGAADEGGSQAWVRSKTETLLSLPWPPEFLLSLFTFFVDAGDALLGGSVKRIRAWVVPRLAVVSVVRQCVVFVSTFRTALSSCCRPSPPPPPPPSLLLFVYIVLATCPSLRPEAVGSAA
jgi:hypothetical protein